MFFPSAPLITMLDDSSEPADEAATDDGGQSRRLGTTTSQTRVTTMNRGATAPVLVLALSA
jgi:hypothetical protein